jgi:hypothetical protein
VVAGMFAFRQTSLAQSFGERRPGFERAEGAAVDRGAPPADGARAGFARGGERGERRGAGLFGVGELLKSLAMMGVITLLVVLVSARRRAPRAAHRAG